MPDSNSSPSANPIELTVSFSLDGQAFALPLAVVSRAVRAVHVTPLPRAPAIVSGVIDIQGEVVPVIDLRLRFGMPAKALSADGQFLVVRGRTRALALRIDATAGVTAIHDGDCIPIDTIVPGTCYLRGIARTADGMILVQDLDTLLALDEEQALEEAIAHGSDILHG